MEELIQIAEDSPTNSCTKPEKAGTVEYIKFNLLVENPYKFTEREFFEEVHYKIRGKKHLKIETYSLKRVGLAKRYGWGIHIDACSRIALVPCNSEKYLALLNDPCVKKSKCYRNYSKQ